MRLILQFCLMALILFGVGNRAWGKVAAGQNIAVRGFAQSELFSNRGDEPPALESSGEAAAWGYDVASDVRDGPNVYAYVKQNPWTAFDPKGLATKLPKWKSLRGTTVKPDHPAVMERAPKLDKEKYKDGVHINENGNADFSPYAKKITPEGTSRINFDKNELKGNSSMNHDVNKAHDKLRKMGYTDEAIAKLEEGHTWHHVEGGMSMELVPTDLHQAYYHVGGSSDIRKGNWFTTGLATVIGFFNPFASTTEAATSGGSIKEGLKQDAKDAITPDAIAIPVAAGEATAEFVNKKIDIASKPNNYTNSQVPLERAIGRESAMNYFRENGEFPPGYQP